MRLSIVGRRRVALLLLIFIILSIVPVNAVTIVDATTNDIKLAITDRLRTQTSDMSGYPDERGLVYYLTSLTIVSMWNEFANSNTDISNSEFKFSDNSLEPYYTYITSSAYSFNTKYGTKTQELSIPTTLSINHSDLDKLTSDQKYIKYSQRAPGILISKCVEEGNLIYKSLVSGYNSKKSKEDKEGFLNDNSSVIRALYKMSQRISDEKEQIISLCKTDDASLTNAYVYGRDVNQITSMLLNPSYKDIVSYGRSLMERDINSISNIGDLEGDDDFHKLTSKQNVNGKDTLAVNKVYMAMFACSSIYRPFASKVGEKEFIDALSSIIPNKPDVIELYNNEKSKKKPLYYRELGEDGKPKGNASRETVKDFIDSIKNLQSGSLVTFKGKFQKSKDSDSFALNNKNGFEIYNDDGKPVDTSLNSKTTSISNTGSTPSTPGTTTTTGGGTTPTPAPATTPQTTNSTGTTTSTTPTTATSAPTNPTAVTGGTGQLGVNVVDDSGKETVLGDTMTDSNLMTDSVFEYGRNGLSTLATGDKTSTRAGTNMVMMYNIFKNSKCTEGTQGLDKKFLYVNPFGDIVLEDDTVVIPASANATYYNSSEETAYNPTTAAFMNSYPKASLSNKYFTVDSSEVDKFIIMMELPGTKVANGAEADSRKDMKQNSIGPLEKYKSKSSAKLIGENKETLKTFQKENNVMPLELDCYNGGSDKLKTMRVFNYKFHLNFGGFNSGLVTGIHDLVVAVPNSKQTVDFGAPLSLFPLTSSKDEGFSDKCKFIANRMFDSINTGEDGEIEKTINPRLDLSHINNIFIQAYNGNENIASFTKNAYKEYTSLEDKDWLTNTSVKLAQSVLDALGNSGGMIGLKSAYEDTVFGYLLYNSNKFMIIILAVVGIFFVAMFSKRRISFLVTILSTIACISITYFMLQIVPVFIPQGINWTINNFSDEVAYKSLIMKEEQYKDPFKNSNSKNGKEDYDLGKTTMTLYTLSRYDVSMICASYGIDDFELLRGTSYNVDDGSGLFIQGTSIKIDLEKFLKGISISGSYDKTNVDAPYKLTVKKYVGNVMDYYSPYYPMLDSFVDRLNKTSELFKIPANSLNYGSGFFKDSFLVDAYVRSDLVLNGQDLNKLKDQFDASLVQKAKDLFGKNNLDLLGLRDFLVTRIQTDSEYLKSIKNTLWYSTMAREGYYNYDTGQIIDQDKMAKLIEKTNRVAKLFLVQNESQMKYVSDENMIKTTVLYAMTEFNREIEYWDDQVRPKNINFEELKMEDVFLPILTKDYDRYIAKNQELIPYIDLDGSWGSVILFIPVMVLSFAISNIMRWGMPLLYLLLLVFIVLRMTFFKVDEMKTAIKGYLKIFGTITVCYILFCLVTSSCYKLSNIVACLLILLFVYSLFFTVMMTVILALITNLTDFGNTNVNAAVRKLGDKTHLSNISNSIREAIQTLRRQDEKEGRPSGYNNKDGRFNKYSYTKSVDDLYNDQIQEQVMRNRHDTFEYHGDYTKFKKKRLKKKKVRNDYRKIEYEDEDDEYDLKEDSHRYKM